MNISPPSTHRQWVLIGALMAVILGGGAGGVWLLRYTPLPHQPQPTFCAEDDRQLRSLLDTAAYDQLLAQSDSLIDQIGPHATLLRYKALALLLLNRGAATVAVAQECLQAGAQGPEAAIASAAIALSAVADKDQPPGLAREAAQRAIVQAGGDSQAGLLAGVAYAAVLRDELGRTIAVPSTQAGATSQPQAGPSQSVAALLARIRQSLEPIYAFNTEEPPQPWIARYWRYGLAMLGETAIYAHQAGDVFTEAQTLKFLVRCCPADVWASPLKIPLRAGDAAKRLLTKPAGVDDHARVAAYTAVALTYESATDPVHADAAYAHAMRMLLYVLNTTDKWNGPLTQVANGSQMRVVGGEYFDYRHCLERIAVHRANLWNTRIAQGTATKDLALAACNQPLFAAMVRLLADKEVNPSAILRAGNVDLRYWPILADAIEQSPAVTDSAWVAARAQAVRLAAAEPPAALHDEKTVDVASAAQQPQTPYGGMSDIALGVGGGRNLAKAPPTEQQRRIAAAAPEPLPDFAWTHSATSRPDDHLARPDASFAAASQSLAHLHDVPAATQPDSDAQGRAAALAKEINTQIASGNTEKALDAYFELQRTAQGDDQTSDLTRELMDMFGQSLKGLGEVQDLIEELEGRKP